MVPMALIVFLDGVAPIVTHVFVLKIVLRTVYVLPVNVLVLLDGQVDCVSIQLVKTSVTTMVNASKVFVNVTLVFMAVIVANVTSRTAFAI